MRSGVVLRKTGKGEREIGARPRTLSMLERRVLILTNGRRDVDEIGDAAGLPNFRAVVDKLLAEGYIEGAHASAQAAAPGGGRSTAADGAGAAAQSGAVNREAREFMVAMLLAFADRVQTARLLDTISTARSDDELESHIDAWHEAIADRPNGLSRADGLRAALLEMLVLPERRRS